MLTTEAHVCSDISDSGSSEQGDSECTDVEPDDSTDDAFVADSPSVDDAVHHSDDSVVCVSSDHALSAHGDDVAFTAVSPTTVTITHYINSFYVGLVNSHGHLDCCSVSQVVIHYATEFINAIVQ